jgi:hypothetical protein
VAGGRDARLSPAGPRALGLGLWPTSETYPRAQGTQRALIVPITPGASLGARRARSGQSLATSSQGRLSGVGLALHLIVGWEPRS